MKEKSSKIKFLIKATIVILPVLIFVWLLNKQFAPLGHLEIKYNLVKDSPFISELYPKERIYALKLDNKQPYKEILDDIIYFDLKLPRSSYQKAQISIKYKNNNQQLFDLGALTSEELQSYETKTLENKFIDNSSWNKIQEEDLVLLQKEKKFDTIDEFLNSITSKTKIAYHNYGNLPKIIDIDNYKKSDKDLEINYALRGSHTFYTYINNENLNFTFNYVDLNREEGEDPFKINIIKVKDGQIINQKQKKDDGITIASGENSENNFNINIPKLEKGVYKINLDLNEDILIKNIKAKQSKIVFDKSLYLAQSNEYLPQYDSKEKTSTDLYNIGSNLYLKTKYKSGLQNISINEKVTPIEMLDKNYDFNQDTLTESFNKIYTEKSNLILETDGYFVFNKDQYFDPTPKNIVQLNENTNIDNFDYLIAKYNPKAEKENDWKIVTYEFDINKLAKDHNNKLKFRLSSPGLKDQDNKIKIAEIKVLLEKDPLTWEKIVEKIK